MKIPEIRKPHQPEIEPLQPVSKAERERPVGQEQPKELPKTEDERALASKQTQLARLETKILELQAAGKNAAHFVAKKVEVLAEIESLKTRINQARGLY